jgi:hypothetical protein
MRVISSRPPRYQTFPLWFLLGGLFTQASLAERGQQEFQKTILPLLENYCYDCHSDGVRKGKFALDEHDGYSALLGDLDFWDHVRQMLVTHVMPPVDEVSPPLGERDVMVKWIDENVFHFDPQDPDPGHVVLRRLNRTEYDNTVRELLKMTAFKPSSEFPPEDTGYGFDNIGAVLSLSPMLMEKYLRAAGRIRAEVMKPVTAARASVEVGASKFDRKDKHVGFEDDGVLWFFSEAASTATFYVPADGNYAVTFHVAATNAGPDHAKMRYAIDGKVAGDLEVKKAWTRDGDSWQLLQVELPLKQGTRKLTVSFLNDFYDEKAPEGKRDRNLALDKVDVVGPFGLVAPRPSRFLEWLSPNLKVGLPAMELTGEDFHSGAGDSARDTGGIVLASSGWVGHPLEVSQAGKYRITLKVGAQQAGDEAAKFEVRIGDRAVYSSAVTAKNQAPQWFQFETELDAQRHELRVAFLNDYYDEAKKEDRNLWVHEVKVEGPLAVGEALDDAKVLELVDRMGGRLFRRPLAAEERVQWRGLAQAAKLAGESGLGVLGTVLEGMLASPAFLYHPTPMPVGSRVGGTELIDEVTLANRLAYFLWSSPPTDDLLQRATRGELRKDLPAVVRGMIADRKAWAMAEHFAGQWLQLRDMESVYRSERMFPQFRGGVGSSMLKETQYFFDHILRDNRSVVEFLNADYTFVNSTLAKYYELNDQAGLTKDKFKKVSLHGTPRGGILTHGSILTLTSNATRTNIVKRGKFVLESVIGIPPPPVPGDVPTLNEEKVRISHLTLRQQFEKHREDMSCAGCHAFLDPMGFALENYDAVGRWRDTEQKQPIDASGMWVRGQRFKDLHGLRQLLATDLKDDFVRSLAEHLLIYSLGRGIQHQDKSAIAEIVQKTRAADYRFQDMILALVDSVPFQRMRVEEAE